MERDIEMQDLKQEFEYSFEKPDSEMDEPNEE